MGIEEQIKLYQEESKRQIHNMEHTIRQRTCGKVSFFVQTLVSLNPFLTRPWPWSLPYLGPAQPRLSKESCQISPPPLISDYPWYLIKFLISYPWCLSPWPIFSKNPPPLMSPLSTFPSSDLLILFFGYKSPIVLYLELSPISLPSCNNLESSLSYCLKLIFSLTPRHFKKSTS